MSTVQQEIAKTYDISEVEVTDAMLMIYKLLQDYENMNSNMGNSLYSSLKQKMRELVREIEDKNDV